LNELTLRRAEEGDAEAVADLYIRAREAAVPSIPNTVHTDDEVRRWIARHVVPKTETWVAESPDGALAGLLVLDGEWVDQLYVDPRLTGRGVGGELIGLAKRRRPTGLRLWTFESNLGAQRFYERHGFHATDRTAGDNEEGAADILYVWEGATQP
jgi:GNAT superfamily N-acetyltransferase